MHKQRTALIITSGIGVLSVFLPWVSVLLFSASGIDTGIGKIVLVIYLIPLIISFIGDREDALEPKAVTVSMVTGILASILAIYQYIDMKAGLSSLSSSGGDDPFNFDSLISGAVSTGIGLYLSILAGIAIAVAVNKTKGDPKTE